MDPVILAAAVRTDEDTGAGRRLRRGGQIPAVVYGDGTSATSIVTTRQDVVRILHTAAGENVLITLKVTQPDGKVQAARTVLIKEIQHHPVTSEILHVDFHQVSLTKRITVTVLLQFTGDAVGVKQDGGRLDHILWELRVECLPTEIPKNIDVDVSALKIGDSVTVADLKVPSGIKVLHDPSAAVVACLPPVVEKAPEVAADAAAPAEPEVIKQKKPEAEEAAAGAGEAKAEKKEPAKPEKSATERGGSAK